ncbi:MAG: PD-(D/E)XK nuclease family protein [Solirubrobacteraceae bacterium]
MPLTLVTGPANAEKAGYVLGAYREQLDREPLLVVPTRADADHYRRELAEGGAVFGVRVSTFDDLMAEVAERAGAGGRPLGTVARERVAASAVRRARLELLAESARTPGFLRALLALVDELEQRRMEPGRWYGALRAWAAQEPARAAYAEELGALYGAYRDALARLGRPDRTLAQVAALDALRTEPARWRGTPVALYGFDDLTPLQHDAIETLALRVDAPVIVSLTYERGRAAFAGRGATFQELAAIAADHVELPARARHYGAAVLHHVERTLFEEAPADEEAGRRPPGRALMLLEGGGERAELELVAAHVARLLREGVPAEEIAVVLRGPPALARQAFADAGVPIALEERIEAGHTALGRGVAALLRCALPGGSADDLIAWLRTPGKLRRPELADRLEQDVRVAGESSAADARGRWEATHPDFPLAEIDRLAADARDPDALYERLQHEVDRLALAPWRGTAAVLAGADALDMRVARALRNALSELRALARAAPSLAPPPRELLDILERLEVWPARPGPGAVSVAEPGTFRARRVRALFLCGLNEGSFPRPGRPEPFLGDGERRAINAAGGLRLHLREDALDAERFLFYAAASRPTELLALSWAAGDDEGQPLVRSLFVDDVLDHLAPGIEAEARRLGAAGFEAPLAPTERAAARAHATQQASARAPHVASLRDPEVLASLAARETWSASALEAYAGCPVKWFVERLLAPEALEPDPEPMLRGELAHRILEDAFRALADGGGRLVPARLDEARALLHAALARHGAGARLSANPERLRSALRRLEADLLRYVDHAAHAGSALTPAHFEVSFGGREDALGPAVLGDGALRLGGRIDRVDVHDDPAHPVAIVYDYKGKSAPARAKWLEEARLQIGLYMLALPQVLGMEAVGGLYQPLGGDDARPRGLLLQDADPGLRVVGTDRAAADELDALLDGVLGLALDAVRGIRSGALAPNPERCAWKGGCAHPTICRCEAASA